MSAAEASTAAGIEAELDGLRTRRGELDKQLRETVRNHEAAQTALVEGSGDIDAAQTALQRQTVLQTALRTLDGRISELSARHAALAASERREETVRELLRLAGEADGAARRYAAANREAQAALEPHLAEMAAALRELLDTRNAFIRVAHPVVSLQSHDPQTKRQAERFLGELAGRGNLEHILTAWRGTPATAHDNDGSLPTPGDLNLAFALQAATAQRVFK